MEELTDKSGSIMPHVALARSLLYLFAAMTGEENGPFECPPWTQPHWRALFGLAPLQPQVGYEDEIVDIDGDCLGESYALPTNGFVLSREAGSSFAQAKAKTLMDGTTLMAAEQFMKYFWSTWREDSLRNRSLEFTLLSLPPDSKSEALVRHGYPGYRDFVLAMLNRSGGVLATVEDVMVQLRATPAEKWKDDRDTNRRRKGRLAVEEYDVPIPTSGSAVEAREVQAAVARRLFGDEAVNRGGMILVEYVKTVSCLLQRRYESLYRRLKTLRLRSKKQKTEVDRRLKEARQEKTPKALRVAAQAMLEWRKTAQETLEHDDPPFLSCEKALSDLWGELGFEVEEIKKKGKRGGGSKPRVDLPTDAEMELAFQYYIEDYCNALGINDDLPAPSANFSGYIADLAEGEGDIGVDHLQDWSIEQAWESLGLPGATQFPFAEPGTVFPPELGRPPKPKATPKWHQVIGVHAILERAFTKTRGERACPTMLCDDVGLGKTLQIIGIFSILGHIYEQQVLHQDKRLPPAPFTFANHTPYFDGMESLPNLPSLIVAPRTINNQWMSQWDTFTQRGSFIVIRYSVDHGSLEDFCSNLAGVYLQAAGLKGERASKVVVIADLSAISKEAKRCFEPPQSMYKGKQARLLEARGEPAKFKVGIDTKGSILAMRFRVLAVDEIHTLRNCSHAHQGILMIAENSHLVVGATATPVFTSTKDLAAQGRILRYAPLIGDEGQDCCLDAINSMRAREKEWDSKSLDIIQGAAIREAHEAASRAGFDAEDDRFSELLQQAELKYQSEDQSSILRMAYISEEVIQMMRRALRPIIVHRTANSRDPSGSCVLQLPPVTPITTWSPLSAEEDEAVAKVNEEHQQQRELRRKKGKHRPAHIKWTNFLLDQKHATLHHSILPLREQEKTEGLKEGRLLNKLADDWNESNLKEKASTCLLKLDELVEHYWMFSIKKRDFVYYDGSMSLKQRQQVTEKFTKNDECRIMIISNVGAAGLNLTAASVVIFVSGVWSGQEKRQIIGRAWRYGQTRDVVVLDIVAPGGIDLALLGYADGKTCLSDKFLTSEHKLRHAYRQITAPEFDDGEELDSEPEPIVRKPAKPSVRKRKQDDPAIADRRDGATEVMMPTPSNPNKRAKITLDAQVGQSKNPGGASRVAGPKMDVRSVQAKGIPTASGSGNPLTKAGNPLDSLPQVAPSKVSKAAPSIRPRPKACPQGEDAGRDLFDRRPAPINIQPGVQGTFLLR
ncbi:SNF2-related protein [Ceratobasidium theobromae]|uniref:SNF2-related protein n=1 Tax=Ceratobasidium theobromae TaxID=1582974 RepID=A0A5N5Q993_9AGAM|nr:SNF2-related protein [Ceratobasidium theobromae]